ncbi:MAG: hypothetical protein ABSD74_01175 [Rhizomicrobium sp.]
MLTTVTAFREPWEAHMFCSRLNAEGIPAVVSHEFHVGNAWHYSTALGGVKVQVPYDCIEHARTIQQLCASGEFKSLLERDIGDLDDIRCPKCGSNLSRRRRPVIEGILAVAISLWFRTIYPPTGWVCFCENCGTKFRPVLHTRTAGNWLMIWAAIICEVALLTFPFVLVLLDPKFGLVAFLFASMLAIRYVVKRTTTSEINED